MVEEIRGKKNHLINMTISYVIFGFHIYTYIHIIQYPISKEFMGKKC